MTKPVGQPVAGLKTKSVASFHPGGMQSVEVEEPRPVWNGWLTQPCPSWTLSVGKAEQTVPPRQVQPQNRGVACVQVGAGAHVVVSGHAVASDVIVGSAVVDVMKDIAERGGREYVSSTSQSLDPVLSNPCLRCTQSSHRHHLG